MTIEKMKRAWRTWYYNLQNVIKSNPKLGNRKLSFKTMQLFRIILLETIQNYSITCDYNLQKKKKKTINKVGIIK